MNQDDFTEGQQDTGNQSIGNAILRACAYILAPVAFWWFVIFLIRHI
jgi:hypothetical protein